MYPPLQSYGQQPRQPSFTPKAQYGALPGQLTYRSQPSCPPQPSGGDPYPQGHPYGQQPYPPRGHSHQEAPGKRHRGFVWVGLGIRRVVVGGRHFGQLLLRLRRDGLARLGDVGRGDRHHDDHPDVVPPAPDFGVDAGGDDSCAFLPGEAAFEPAANGSPCPPAAAPGHGQAHRKARAAARVIMQAVIPRA
jgi:hypothetical protein